MIEIDLPDVQKRRRADSTNTLYFVQNSVTKAIKIGYTTKTIKDRINSIQAENHVEIEVLALVSGSRDLVRDIRAGYKPYNIRGEWYRPEQEIMNLVEMAKSSDATGIDTEAASRAKRERGITRNRGGKKVAYSMS